MHSFSFHFETDSHGGQDGLQLSCVHLQSQALVTHIILHLTAAILLSKFMYWAWEKNRTDLQKDEGRSEFVSEEPESIFIYNKDLEITVLLFVAGTPYL